MTSRVAEFLFISWRVPLSQHARHFYYYRLPDNAIFLTLLLLLPFILYLFVERQKAEMDARLKKKAELKAKAAQPKSYAESLQKELEKKINQIRDRIL